MRRRQSTALDVRSFALPPFATDSRSSPSLTGLTTQLRCSHSPCLLVRDPIRRRGGGPRSASSTRPYWALLSLLPPIPTPACPRALAFLEAAIYFPESTYEQSDERCSLIHFGLGLVGAFVLPRPFAASRTKSVAVISPSKCFSSSSTRSRCTR